MTDDENVTELEVLLSYDTLKLLTAAMEQTGCSASDLVEQALRQFLSAGLTRDVGEDPDKAEK